jgi:hypothetical protein
MPISTCQSYEKHHGREEYKHTSFYVAPPDMPNGWKGIQRVVKLRRWGIRNHKPYDHTRYYILSKPFPMPKSLQHAQVVAKGIRDHWGIENNLHWVKNVVMGEDDMPIHDPHDASVVAVFNTVALNILRIAGYSPVLLWLPCPERPGAGTCLSTIEIAPSVAPRQVPRRRTPKYLPFGGQFLHSAAQSA